MFCLDFGKPITEAASQAVAFLSFSSIKDLKRKIVYVYYHRRDFPKLVITGSTYVTDNYQIEFERSENIARIRVSIFPVSENTENRQVFQ
jgi:hypothetical protein